MKLYEAKDQGAQVMFSKFVAPTIEDFACTKTIYYPIRGRINVISAMKEYSNKSLEELRHEYYQVTPSSRKESCCVGGLFEPMEELVPEHYHGKPIVNVSAVEMPCNPASRTRFIGLYPGQDVTSGTYSLANKAPFGFATECSSSTISPSVSKCGASAVFGSMFAGTAIHSLVTSPIFAAGMLNHPVTPVFSTVTSWGHVSPVFSTVTSGSHVSPVFNTVNARGHVSPASTVTSGSHVSPVFSTVTSGSHVSPVFNTVNARGHVSPASTVTAGSHVSPVFSTVTAGSHVSPASTVTSGSHVSPVSTVTAGSYVPPASTVTAGSRVSPVNSVTAGSHVLPVFSTVTSGSHVSPVFNTVNVRGHVSPASTVTAGSHVSPVFSTVTAGSHVSPASTVTAGSHVSPVFNTVTAGSRVSPVSTVTAGSHVSPVFNTVTAGSHVSPASTVTAGSHVSPVFNTVNVRGHVSPASTVTAGSHVSPVFSTVTAGSHVSPASTVTAGSHVSPVFNTVTAGSRVSPVSTVTAGSHVSPVFNTVTAESHVSPASTFTAGSHVSPASTVTAGSHVSPASTVTAGSHVSPIFSTVTAGSHVSPVFSTVTSGSHVSPVSTVTAGSYVPPASTVTAGSRVSPVNSVTAGSHVLPVFSTVTAGSHVSPASTVTAGSHVSPTSTVTSGCHVSPVNSVTSGSHVSPTSTVTSQSDVSLASTITYDSFMAAKPGRLSGRMFKHPKKVSTKAKFEPNFDPATVFGRTVKATQTWFEEPAIEAQISCPICLETYVAMTKTPVALPSCGHTFCRPCLQTLEEKGSVDCPSCMTHLGVAVSEIPTLHSILSLSEVYRKAKASGSVLERCESHGDQLCVWCRHCSEALCGLCLLDTQRHKCHKLERIINIADIYNNVKQQARNFFEYSENRQNKIMNEMHVVIKRIVELCHMSNSIESQVKIVSDVMKNKGNKTGIKVSMQTLSKLDDALKFLHQATDSLDQESELSSQDDQLVMSAEGVKDIIECNEMLNIKLSQCNINESKGSDNGQGAISQVKRSDSGGARIQVEECDEKESCSIQFKGSEIEEGGSIQTKGPDKRSGVSNQVEMLSLGCCGKTSDGRQMNLMVENDQLHFCALEYAAQDALITVQVPLLERFLSREKPEVFFELSVDNKCLGRVYIQLWGDMRRAKHFLALCLGTLGPSYKGSKFDRISDWSQPGEVLHCKGYSDKSGPSSLGLMDNLEWDGEYRQLQKAGQLIASGGGQAEKDGSFGICTKDNLFKTFSCPFGMVVSGLDVVREAVNHVGDVVVSEVGAVAVDILH
nr:mucin-5AC-like isoform X2 [Procambarus clarkii]